MFFLEPIVGLQRLLRCKASKLLNAAESLGIVQIITVVLILRVLIRITSSSL